MGIVIAIALFSAIVLFHELGHFLFAKYHKVKVEEFALGLGPTIVGKQIGETKYSIKLLPFGGCCMMKGEEDPSDQEDDSFSAKSPLARISILFAGPMFNFIFAFVTASFLILAVGTDLPVAGPVEEGSAAYEAGIREGDEIISLDGDRITNFRELSLYNVFHQKDPEVTVLYERDGQEFTTEMLRTKNEKGQYQMGIMSSGYTRVSPAQVLPRCILEMKLQVSNTYQSLKGLFTGAISVKQLSGPVGIVQSVSGSYQDTNQNGLFAVLVMIMNYSLLLNVNLGVMNLLPIPALDGGHILFAFIEIIRGKKFKYEEVYQAIGMATLFSLMIIVFVWDIVRIF